MIGLSRTASVQVADLARRYQEQGRVDAVKRLRSAVEQAAYRIETQRGPFFPAPRPYPLLLRPGWRWLKEGSYWVAFSPDTQSLVIRAVFHEAANIPNRL